MAAQTSGVAQCGGQMAFPDTSGTGENHIGAGVNEVECEQVFDLHSVDLGRPVPIPSGHGLDDREAGVLDAALHATVMAQGEFTGDKFLKVLKVAATIGSSMFGGWHGIFE